MIYLDDLYLKSYLKYYFYNKTRAFAEYFLYKLPNRKQFKQLKQLKDKNKDKCAFVFANGPSLNKLDPYKIVKYQQLGFDVFAGNSYIRTKYGEIVKPDYYFCTDPVHYGIYKNKILTDEEKEEAMMEIKMIKDQGIALFVPHRYYKHLEYDKKYILNDSFDVFNKNINNIMRPCGHVALTLYKALSAACYMGYQKIYICGFDNDYFKTLSVDKRNRVYFESNHFYEENNTKRDIYWIKGGIDQVLLEYYLIFWYMKKFKDQPIINLNENGLIDTFPKDHDLDIYY